MAYNAAVIDVWLRNEDGGGIGSRVGEAHE